MCVWIGTSDTLLLAREWTFDLQKIWEISWLSEQLLASQEQVRPLDLHCLKRKNPKYSSHVPKCLFPFAAQSADSTRLWKCNALLYLPYTDKIRVTKVFGLSPYVLEQMTMNVRHIYFEKWNNVDSTVMILQSLARKKQDSCYTQSSVRNTRVCHIFSSVRVNILKNTKTFIIPAGQGLTSQHIGPAKSGVACSNHATVICMY